MTTARQQVTLVLRAVKSLGFVKLSPCWPLTYLFNFLFHMHFSVIILVTVYCGQSNLSIILQKWKKRKKSFICLQMYHKYIFGHAFFFCRRDFLFFLVLDMLYSVIFLFVLLFRDGCIYWSQHAQICWRQCQQRVFVLFTACQWLSSQPIMCPINCWHTLPATWLSISTEWDVHSCMKGQTHSGMKSFN